MMAFGGQPQHLHDAFRRYRFRLIHRRAVEPFGHQACARDGGAAAEYLNSGFGNPIAAPPYLDAYDRAFVQRSYLTRSDVVAVERSDPLERPDSIQHLVRIP